jgi:hypothetical protein
MSRLSVSTFALLMIASTPVMAQQFPKQPAPIDRGNAQEQDACRPDVDKFCQTQLQVNPNDVLGILSCLQANRTRISTGCQKVLASHGQ